MAASSEILGSSFLQQTSLLPSWNSPLFRRDEQSRLSVTPPPKQSRRRSCRAVRPPLAAVVIKERFVKVEREEKAVKFKVRAAVTVRRKNEDLGGAIANQVDALCDKLGRSVLMELVSTEMDPGTRKPRSSNEAELRGWFEKKDAKTDRVVYAAEFTVDSNFNEAGAITVLNRHQREFFLESIVVEGFACGPIHFPCNSWVQPSRLHPTKRIFFSNKPYLPSQTPAGLKELRQQELKELRGDGKGERKITDRIYDYDVYNDLGNPDKGIQFARPVLGGDKMPYPRRLRTGRAPTTTDKDAERRVEDPLPVYAPRDDQFEEGKVEMITAGARKAVLHNLLPLLVASISPESHDFKAFHEVDNLFKEGLRLKQSLQDQLFHKLPLVSKIQDLSEAKLRYDTPDIITKDKFAWLRDDEFARQTLAGINPVNIERLQAFPPISKLDPAIYGPPESAIREEHIIRHLDGLSVQQALEANKLFMLDYHDAYMPFLDRINAQDGRKAYGTRTIFFLSEQETLKPIAIELSLPPARVGDSRAKRVFTPPVDATSCWLWQLAKAHVCSNDAGVHQLVNHWLKTHACMEPFIVAAHRQLSAMHPIYKLLKPHMRYTLQVNALARQILISGGGIIESSFTPGPIGMEICAAAYRQNWRIDQETLPADLIKRGMAVEDSTKPHGLRLVIEDYPYASDGLLLWSAIEEWVKRYVAAYYPDAESVLSDFELQSWYAEAVNVGHADVRYAPWWPRLSSPGELSSFLTTVVWLCSAQHAALNFGQYPLGGYIPNRPPLLRRLVPTEGDPEYEHFLSDPAKFFLASLPSLTQTTTFMTVIDTLSTHSVDEEYLGERPDPYTWTGDAEMVEAFHEFAAKVRRAEAEIGRRNADPDRRNRCGAGVLPYELMAPTSGPGITCRGVPNSVTI
ncbi:putative lipoxygenase 5 [Zingiber officinale]|uniref:putative lipoxygenase 5 n=1 Tax=Zingiber officinale TaxID=94328 RepID=UPI001C4CB3E0|nr:putative lipoxygenase 5 [Zingiber officinale]